MCQIEDEGTQLVEFLRAINWLVPGPLARAHFYQSITINRVMYLPDSARFVFFSLLEFATAQDDSIQIQLSWVESIDHEQTNCKKLVNNFINSLRGFTSRVTDRPATVQHNCTPTRLHQIDQKWRSHGNWFNGFRSNLNNVNQAFNTQNYIWLG